LPTQSAAPSMMAMTPIDHDISMFRPSEAPFSMTATAVRPQAKDINDSDASINDGLLLPTRPRKSLRYRPESEAEEPPLLGETVKDVNQSKVVFVLPEVEADMKEETDPRVVVEMAKHFDKSKTENTRKTLDFMRDLSSRRVDRPSLGLDSNIEVVVEEQKVFIDVDRKQPILNILDYAGLQQD